MFIVLDIVLHLQKRIILGNKFLTLYFLTVFSSFDKTLTLQHFFKRLQQHRTLIDSGSLTPIVVNFFALIEIEVTLLVVITVLGIILFLTKVF